MFYIIVWYFKLLSEGHFGTLWVSGNLLVVELQPAKVQKSIVLKNSNWLPEVWFGLKNHQKTIVANFFEPIEEYKNWDWWDLKWQFCYLSLRCLKTKSREGIKWPHIPHMTSNAKTRKLLLSPTFKIEENKVLLFFGLKVTWMGYGHFEFSQAFFLRHLRVK